MGKTEFRLLNQGNVPWAERAKLFFRSDGVLNPSGVRFGSGEIYTVMEQFSDVLDDSLCVGQRRPQDKDERVLLFLKMRSGHAFTPELVRKIKEAIRKSLSARHVPAYVFEVTDIPVRSYFMIAAMYCASSAHYFTVHRQRQEDRNSG